MQLHVQIILPPHANLNLEYHAAFCKITLQSLGHFCYICNQIYNQISDNETKMHFCLESMVHITSLNCLVTLLQKQL